MNNNILISVIVPIYNVCEYLPKSIESIINQTHTNIEILLVDDGSTDESCKICDEYAKKDSRIKVIHKQNGGITSARKAGILAATGKYVGFVDGDDWIDSNMYEELLAFAVSNSADIVLSDMYRQKFSGDETIWSGTQLKEGVYSLESDRELISKCMVSGISSTNIGTNGGVHVKLFEYEILKKHLLLIDDSVHGFADDKVVVYPVLLHSDIIYVKHKAYYHGVDRKSSATHTKNEFFFQQMDWVYKYLKSVFEKEVYKDILLKQLMQFVMLSSIKNINELAGSLLIPDFYLSCKEKILGKRIVLHGAGKVGRSVHSVITQNKLCKIVLWTDKVPDESAKVSSIQKILETEYDFVLVAVLEHKLFEIIKEQLMQIGIDERNIIWGTVKNIVEEFDFCKKKWN